MYRPKVKIAFAHRTDSKRSLVVPILLAEDGKAQRVSYMTGRQLMGRLFEILMDRDPREGDRMTITLERD